MIIYFDTETTGLYPGNVCQLSYVIEDREKIVPKNFFFAVDEMPISAQMIHGFSKEKLDLLSDGKRFVDHFAEINNDFSSAKLVVSHNFSFDDMFMRAEYENLNKAFTVKDSFCTMKKTTAFCKLPKSKGLGYKYPKLTELCAVLGVTEEDVQRCCQRFYGLNAGVHDARYDTVALLLATRRLRQEDEYRFLNNYL